MSGRLVLCGTPIGNLDDAPPRLAEALREADIVYAEDTRRSRILLDALGVEAKLRSYFVGNEEARSTELGELLSQGLTVALLTDAGMPSVADPGYSAVRAAIEAGAAVTVVPGPSAVTAALALSGMPADRFTFEGFLPRKGGRRSLRLGELQSERRTMVLFSAKGRLLEDLTDLAANLGDDRPVVVTREMTKAFEEVWRGTLAEAVERWSGSTKGELTLVIHGAPDGEQDLNAALEHVGQMVSEGAPMAEAVRQVAEMSGIRRRSLYEEALRSGLS